jgi:hypothetical protein
MKKRMPAVPLFVIVLKTFATPFGRVKADWVAGGNNRAVVSMRGKSGTFG